MPRMEFEPTILVFERAKTFRTSDRVATVTGLFCFSQFKSRDVDKISIASYEYTSLSL
jgi:hypothetical protein